MQRREQHADPRAKSQRPSERVDEQAQIARVADDAIDPARNKRVPGLDGDQPAEPTAEHEDRPDPQRPAGGEKHHAEPANGVPVERPEFLAIRVGRQIGGEQPDQGEGQQDPAVATILTLARAQISAVKSAAPASAKTTTASTIRAGWEKKAANRPSRGWQARDRRVSSRL